MLSYESLKIQLYKRNAGTTLIAVQNVDISIYINSLIISSFFVYVSWQGYLKALVFIYCRFVGPLWKKALSERNHHLGWLDEKQEQTSTLIQLGVPSASWLYDFYEV